MEKQLSFELENLSSGKKKDTSVEQHLSGKKEQRPKRKNQREQLVSRLLPKVEKELKLKSPALEDNTQEVETPEESLSDKEKLFVNLISVEELAVIFRLAPQTIRNWVALGKIPYVKIGRRHFFQKRSVQQWLNRKEKSQWQ
ncbi:MAG: helix-turn-helix domain-containing protein [Bdellovibrionales bacterium]|nr:helix-turn-helix domain-containing protein [Bdellovibrionales bacterium]